MNLYVLGDFNVGYWGWLNPDSSDTADATIAANYEYGPFGEVIRATGPLAFQNPFLFQTEFYDWETGKYYVKHRYYDPSTGRWLSRDPVNEPGFMLVASDDSSKGSNHAFACYWACHQGFFGAGLLLCRANYESSIPGRFIMF